METQNKENTELCKKLDSWIEKLKALRIYAVISSYFYPVYTQEQINHPDKQELEVKCFKNGKYTHTVTLHYFTKEEIKRLHNSYINALRNKY